MLEHQNSDNYMPWRKIITAAMAFCVLTAGSLTVVRDVIPRQIGLMECKDWQERPVVGNLGRIALKIKRDSHDRVDENLLSEKIADRNNLPSESEIVYSGQSLMVPAICNPESSLISFYKDTSRMLPRIFKLPN